MSVCSGYDYRQRDATLVHQHMTLASIFFPYPWDLAPQLLLPAEPLPLLRQYFATPRQYPPVHRILPNRHAITEGRSHLSAIEENMHGSNVHCQNVLSVRPSTDNLFSIHITIPSKTFRGSMGLRPPPASLLYSLSAFLFGKTGISGLTLSQNASDTSQDRVFAISTSINLRL